MHRAALALAFALSASAQVHTTAQIHTTPMAGRWFEPTAPKLEQQRARSFELAASRQGQTEPRQQLAALIVPHAGLNYSGAVAAAAWRLADSPSTPRNVILLAFSHKGGVRGVVAPKLSAYRTPLGLLPIDAKLTAELGFPLADEATLCDHSLENQLPFLQKLKGLAAFVPLYVGDMTPAERAAAARKLAARAALGDLIVASTDFTHHGRAYGYSPFGTGPDLPEKLRERALEAFETIGSLDHTLYDRFLQSTGDTMCGVDPVRLLMATLQALEQKRSHIYMTTVDYLNSGDLTHDWNTAVSYGALAFYPASAYSVTPAERTLLLAHARATLDNSTSPSVPTSPALRQRTGAFVTIKKKGELRGCIGTLSPRTALWATIADRTLAAARSDPRFPPLTAAEGPVTLEVSLLTPLKRLASWRQWHPGLGGVLMLGDKGGLLLPQIAFENGWGQTEFLQQLSHKAGLPANAYRDPKARLYVFEAQVFGEQGH